MSDERERIRAMREEQHAAYMRQTAAAEDANKAIGEAQRSVKALCDAMLGTLEGLEQRVAALEGRASRKHEGLTLCYCGAVLKTRTLYTIDGERHRCPLNASTKREATP